MRKGRFFRRKHRLADPAIDRLHDAGHALEMWRDDLDSTLNHSWRRLRHHGRDARYQLESAIRQHPTTTLLIAGTAVGLLLWALLRRPRFRGAEGVERMEHW